MFDVRGALEEVLTKSEGLIQRETAYKWASRAIACYTLYAENQELHWALRAEEYRHEAIEHAAVAEDDCATLSFIEQKMKAAALRAGVR